MEVGRGRRASQEAASVCLERSPAFQVDTEKKHHILSPLQYVPLLCIRNYLKMAKASHMIFAAAPLQCVLAA